MTATSGANSIDSERLFYFNINGNGKSPMILLVGQQQDTVNHNMFEVETLANICADECSMDKAA